MNLIITAVVSIAAGVMSSMIFEYIKKLAPKIRYTVGEGIPIEIEGKRKCFHIITVYNSSNRTIKDITISIASPVSKLERAEVSIPRALKYEIDEKEGSVEILIPFLSKGDQFSITVYSENKYVSLYKPDVVIRSPEGVKSINQGTESARSTNIAAKVAPAILAGVLIAITLDIITPQTNQKDYLMLLSSSFGLHELTMMYSTQHEINYYDQGALIYAKASECEDNERIKKYKDYLVAIRDSGTIAKLSKCVINYHIGKLCLLLKDESEAKQYFEEAIRLDKKHITGILKYDEEVKVFFEKTRILGPNS